MRCPKCNTENKKDANYCVSCGEKLKKSEKSKKDTQNKVESNEAGIRKAIKRESKTQVKGYFIGLTVIYFIVVIAMSLFFDGLFAMAPTNAAGENVILNTVQEFSVFFFASILYYAIANTILSSPKNKEKDLNSILNKSFQNITNVLVIFAVYAIIVAAGYVCGFISEKLIFLGFPLTIAYIVLIIYYAPVIEIITCMLSDDKHQKLSFNEILPKAILLAKGNRKEYYAMVFSFIPWFLLGILTLGILYIWLLPYYRITITNLYRRWQRETTFDEVANGISNGAVIGTTIGTGCGCLIVLCGFIFMLIAIYFVADQNHIDNGIDSFINQIENIEDFPFNDSSNYNPHTKA